MFAASRAEGPADWSHLIRANSVQLFDLARTRAKEGPAADTRRRRARGGEQEYPVARLQLLVTPAAPQGSTRKFETIAADLHAVPDALIFTQDARARDRLHAVDVDRQ